MDSVQEDIGSVKRVWGKWKELLSQRESGEILSLIRLLLGFIILVDLGSLYLKQLHKVLWTDIEFGGVCKLPSLGALGPPDQETTSALVLCTLLTAVLTTVGLGGRIPIFVCLQSYGVLTMVNNNTNGSYDILITSALWLLVLGDANATLSLDCYLRTGSLTSERMVAAWPRYLIIYQLAIMYGFSGIQKVHIGWTPMGDYSALYYILQQTTWQNWDMTWVAYCYPLTQIACCIAWWWEVLTPFWLVCAFWTHHRKGNRLAHRLNRIFDLRLAWAVVGICMHTSIAIFMSVGPFSYVSLALYLALLSPEELPGRRSA